MRDEPKNGCEGDYENFDDGEFQRTNFFVCPVHTGKSNNPDFPKESYGKFELKDMDDSEYLVNFRFYKREIETSC